MHLTARKAALRQITRFHEELEREGNYQYRHGYDPKRWSSFSQDWNRRQQKWRSDKGLSPAAASYRDDVHRQALTGPAVALFSCWRAWHYYLDWERTRRPGILELLLTPGRRDVLKRELKEVTDIYEELYWEVTDRLL